jgi:hypothetical protein
VSSPDASYGSSACPQQFIVVVQGVSGRSFNFSVAPHDAPSNRAECEATTLTMAAFGHRASGWVSLGSRFYQGSWTAFGTAGVCSYSSTSTPLPGVSGAAGYDEVRAAVSAYRGSVRLRVKAGVSYGNGSC